MLSTVVGRCILVVLFPYVFLIMVTGVPVMDYSPVQAAQATKSPDLIMDWHEIEGLLFEKRTLA